MPQPAPTSRSGSGTRSHGRKGLQPFRTRTFSKSPGEPTTELPGGHLIRFLGSVSRVSFSVPFQINLNGADAFFKFLFGTKLGVLELLINGEPVFFDDGQPS